MLEVQGGQGTDLRGTLPLVKPIKHPRLSTAFLLVCAIGAPMTAATMNTAYCINSSSISFACTVTNTGPNSQQAESSAACDWGTGRGNINAFAAANWFTGYPGLRTSYGWVGGLPIDDVFAGHMWAQAHTEWVVTGGTGTGQMEVDYSLAMSNWGSVHASTSFPRGSPQNRPTRVTSKPANGREAGQELLYRAGSVVGNSFSRS